MNTGTGANSSQIILSTAYLNSLSTLTFYLIQKNEKTGIIEKNICVFDATTSSADNPDLIVISKKDIDGKSSIVITPHFSQMQSTLNPPTSHKQDEKILINKDNQYFC